MKTLQVRPLEQERWHGKKGKESFTEPKTITALVSASTGKYKTGLTEEEEVKYGKMLGVDLSAFYNKDQPHPFWDGETYVVKLENKTNIINIDTPIGFIQSKVLKESKYVANSMKEWEDGLWPEALFVIIDDETDAEIKASKIALQEEIILNAAKLTSDKKASIVLILSNELVRGKSDSLIKVKLNDLIEKKPQEVLKVMKMNDKDMETYALILEAQHKFIITKSGHRYMYMDSVIGEDIYEAIAYLNKKDNQELKLRITKSLND